MSDTPSTDRQDLGPNAGLVDEMYRLYQENPQAVSEGWRDFFADYRPNVPRRRPPAAFRRRRTPRPSRPHRLRPPPVSTGNGSSPVVLAGETPETLRGAAARIVDNMEASLERARPPRRCARCRPSCSRSTGRSSTTISHARTAARCRSRTSSASRCLRALARRARDELELRHRRRQAERRAPRAREPRARDRPAARPTAHARCSCRT